MSQPFCLRVIPVAREAGWCRASRAVTATSRVQLPDGELARQAAGRIVADVDVDDTWVDLELSLVAAAWSRTIHPCSAAGPR